MASSLPPTPPVPSVSFFSVFLCVAGLAYTGNLLTFFYSVLMGEAGGTKSSDGEEGLSSINFSILSGMEKRESKRSRGKAFFLISYALASCKHVPSYLCSLQCHFNLEKSSKVVLYHFMAQPFSNTVLSISDRLFFSPKLCFVFMIRGKQSI